MVKLFPHPFSMLRETCSSFYNAFNYNLAISAFALLANPLTEARKMTVTITT
jgi:hypothetical protein